MWENGRGLTDVAEWVGSSTCGRPAGDREGKRISGTEWTMSDNIVMPSSGARAAKKWGKVAVTDGVTTVTRIIRPVGLVTLHPFPCGAMTIGVVWCGVVWCSVVWYHGVVWCGVVWCGVVWYHGVVWCGVVWCGVVWCGVVWCAVLRCAVELTAHVTQDVQH